MAPQQHKPSMNGEQATRHIEVLEERVNSIVQRFDERVISQHELRDVEQRALEAYKVAAKEAILIAFTAADKAVNKAEQAQGRVNEGQNEFRKALNDQTRDYATKEAVGAIDARIQLLERSSSAGQGRGDITKILWAVAASILIAVVVFIITQVLPHG